MDSSDEELTLADRLNQVKDGSKQAKSSSGRQQKRKRASKHAPQEVSSKRQVSRFREAIPVDKRKVRGT